MNRAYIESMQFSQLEVAKNLYKEAVILFFEKREALAVFCLARQAYEVLLRVVHSHQYLKNDYLTDAARTQILQCEKKVTSDDLNLTANTNSSTLVFDPKINEMLLLTCAVMFNEGVDPEFLFSKVFLIWAMAMHPEWFAETFTTKVLEGEGYQLDPYDFEVMLTLLKP